MGYAKLFSTLLSSSIWSEDDKTRIMWITMLAMADKNGEVMGSVPGMARIGGMTIEDAERAIERLKSPDKHSRTKDAEGRRIVDIDGGWEVVNYLKYRRLASLDDRREKDAERQRRKRMRDGGSINADCHDMSRTRHAPVTHFDDIAEADTYSDTEKFKTTSEDVGKNAASVARLVAAPASKKVIEPDEEWLAGLAKDPAYAGIDVPREFHKMGRWCETNRKHPTRRRFVNWLNRSEKPIQTPVAATVARNPNWAVEKASL